MGMVQVYCRCGNKLSEDRLNFIAVDQRICEECRQQGDYDWCESTPLTSGGGLPSLHNRSNDHEAQGKLTRSPAQSLSSKTPERPSAASMAPDVYGSGSKKGLGIGNSFDGQLT
jgi:hypothetical protein